MQEVDLVSGHCDEVFHFEIRILLERRMASILGDFIIFALHIPGSGLQCFHMLVNWRNETCIILWPGFPFAKVFIFQTLGSIALMNVISGMLCLRRLTL